MPPPHALSNDTQKSIKPMLMSLQNAEVKKIRDIK